MMRRTSRLLAVFLILLALMVSQNRAVAAEGTGVTPSATYGVATSFLNGDQDYYNQCGRYWPSRGVFEAYHVGALYEAILHFKLNDDEKKALDKCSSRFGEGYVELDFTLHGFFTPSWWDGYSVQTNIPGARHDTAVGDPANHSSPGLTNIEVGQLNAEVDYVAIIAWNDSAVWAVPFDTPRVSFEWVPSHAARGNELYCFPFKFIGPEYCIFGTKGRAYLSGGYYDGPHPQGGDGIPFDDNTAYPFPPGTTYSGGGGTGIVAVPGVSSATTQPPPPPNPLGPDFNHDGTPDIWAFNKHDVGSGKTVYFILDGRDPTQTLRVGATAFGWLDDNFSIAVGPDWNGDAIPDIYAFNRHDAGSGKTVYFVLNGNAPDQFLQIGATPFGWTDSNWSFSPGPDFNHDGRPELYAFNRHDVGSGKTVYYVLDGMNPEHQLQVGVTPFGFTDSNWSFSAGPDWNSDGTPEFYAFNKQDAGSKHTVYFVLDGRDPAHQLQVGQLPFTWTSDDWSFAPVGDFNHDGRVDFYAFDRHDGGSGKTVYFYLDGNDPSHFLQVGATPFGWTDGNWSYGAGDVVGSNVTTFVAFNRQDPGTGKTVYYKMDSRSPDQYSQVGATPFGYTDSNWSFAPGPDFNHDGTPDLYAFNRHDVGSGKTVYYVLDGGNPEHALQVGATPFGWTDANWDFGPGPDFNHDGHPDLYAFNRQDPGTSATVYYVLDGTNPEHQLQVGRTPFGYTNADWSFSAGADWNHDGTPDLYAFNKHDVGSGHTVYYVLDGTNPQHELQVGATAFGFTDANYSFTPGPDLNHDGTPDFYGFDKQDAGTGKTVYFVLNGRAPDQFLQIGATAMSTTDANWDFGVVGS